VTVRVVVADDHPMFRLGLVAALGSVEDVEVVGEAADGAELLATVAATRPDVVLTDLSMPSLDGASATARLRTDHPQVRVLVLTMHEDDENLFAALRAGASGYLLKGASRDEIARAVRSVADGQSVYGAPVARRIVDFFTGAHTDYRAQAFPALTARERQILDLMAAGLGNHEIARRLVLSERKRCATTSRSSWSSSAPGTARPLSCSHETLVWATDSCSSGRRAWQGAHSGLVSSDSRPTAACRGTSMRDVNLRCAISHLRAPRESALHDGCADCTAQIHASSSVTAVHSARVGAQVALGRAG
jgi:DNA-binding NarL/FixJ family response regulator